MALRRDTPAWGGFAHFAHGSASLPPRAVHEAMQEWLRAERELGVLRASERLGGELDTVRARVARLVNASPHQVALLDGASRAWSCALGAATGLRERVHVVTTSDEYGANGQYLVASQSRGRLDYVVASARVEGEPLASRIAGALREVGSSCLPIVSVAAVPAAHGVATTLEGLAELVHARSGLLFVDASHAVGQLPIDMQALDIDVLVFPSRKWLRGPKGVGVLCLSDRALERLGMPEAVDLAGATWTGGSQVRARPDARRFEAREHHPGLHLALGAACDYARTTGPARIARRNAHIRDRVTAELERRFGWVSCESGHPGGTALITYRVPARGPGGEQFVRLLRDLGVDASSVGAQQAPWALVAPGIGGLLRLTPHYFTSDEEIERLVLAIAKLEQAFAPAESAAGRITGRSA